MKQIILAALLLLPAQVARPAIDRTAVLQRNNPKTSALAPLSSLTVGNGGFAYTADITGLQTFPSAYAKGVPLGTMSDWGWHAFPNSVGFTAAEALTEDGYSIERFSDVRRRAAAGFLRANPHRLHLGMVGFDVADTADVKSLGQELVLQEGTLHSAFMLKKGHYNVTTAVHPDRDIVAARVDGDRRVPAITLRFPYPTGEHSDDACRWNADYLHSTEAATVGTHAAILTRKLDATTYYVTVNWEGDADIVRTGPNAFRLVPKDKQFAFAVEFTPEATLDAARIEASRLSPGAVMEAAAAHWRQYWAQGAMTDFSRCTDPRARELERRVVLSQYLLAVNCAGDTPPQETGLTYNSWFGKFHLEMIWWHQAQFALWGHPELLEHTMQWFFKAAPKAREIARRQGFGGLRWMKMTDPSAEEAPSKTGSYLIWQQPHLIYLAELLRRAGCDITAFKPLIDETADFMLDYARKSSDDAEPLYLRRCIPAQETLPAALTVNPPLEMAYWQWALGVAGRKVSMAPLAASGGCYVAAASFPDSYANPKCISDHPAVLGALGMIPQTGLVDKALMQQTLNKVWDCWNWPTTWGWDYPLTAMCAARLGDKQKAVDALLMDQQKNTYLPNGHNYQDQRLRIYLPGNGGLLAAVAMMCAGWDGCTERNPGFPDGWDVQWEGLLPMP